MVRIKGIRETRLYSTLRPFLRRFLRPVCNFLFDLLFGFIDIALPIIHIFGLSKWLCQWLERTIIRHPIQLKPQIVWLRCRDILAGSDQLKEINQYLTTHFCTNPFERISLDSFTARMCCPSYLTLSIGSSRSPFTAWNSRQAKKIRQSMLDGSFRYCSRVYCPQIVSRSLPLRKDVPAHMLSLTQPPPKHVALSYDYSCNIRCPSCRNSILMADKKEQARIEAFSRQAVLPLLKTASTVCVSGAGDPFASHHFRKLLSDIASRGQPGINLMTNGVLCDEKAWHTLRLESIVKHVRVSLDAATNKTYEIVRRGGSWNRVMANIEFLSNLRQQGKIDYLGLDFIVQNTNLAEIEGFIKLGKYFKVDRVQFAMIRNWSSCSHTEFERHFVGISSHPRYKEFLSILHSPLFADPIVDPGNLWRFSDIEPSMPMQRSMQGLKLG